MTDRIIELHLQGLGRYKISQATGISEKRIRTVIAKYKQSNTPTVTLPGEKVTFNGNDTIIDKVIKLTPDQKKTKEDIMEAVGFSPDEWECTSAEIASWNGLVKGGDAKPIVTDLYSVRVKVRPKKNGFDLDKAIAQINSAKPRHTAYKPEDNGERTIEVGVTDAHFGVNTYEDYEPTINRIKGNIFSADRVILLVGTDNIHVNGHSYKTINDTQLEPIDLNQAWNDCLRFYEELIEYSMVRNRRIDLVYLPANHDRDISWCLAKTLERLYPALNHQTGLDTYKALRVGKTAIGWTHGDECKIGNVDRIFMREFPEIFGDAETLEVHTGHVHREGAGDISGVMVRTLPTRTARTEWTKKKGYHSVRRFQCFEYDDSGLSAIYYV